MNGSMNRITGNFNHPSNHSRMNKHTILYLFILLIGVAPFADAQDTARKKTIDITSTFKPVLREAAKINFNATPPAADGRRAVQPYQVPAQNLSFAYQPMAIQPVSLQQDSLLPWLNSNYIKVGVGSVTIPYIQTGFSFGDGKSSFYNVFANHYSSKGSLPFQKNSQTDVTASAIYKTTGNLEWSGQLGFKSQEYFLYGYTPATLAFNKDQLRQRFQTFGGKLGLRNLELTEFGLLYDPSLKISVFTGKNDIHEATEANAVLNVPVQKTINDRFAVKLALTADLTNYRPANLPTLQNNLYSVSPTVLFNNDNLALSVGVRPVWQPKSFKILPEVMADISTNNKHFTIQLGWVGQYDKGSYERLASINPWLALPDTLMNTRVQEAYAGFKGSASDHFTYSAKIGYVTYHDMPLFVNDDLDGKTFETIYSASLQSLRVHGEIGYLQGESFSAGAHLTLNEFHVDDQLKAYGMLPFEMGASLRWKIVKDLWLTSDILAFGGAAYRTPDHAVHTGKAGFDLSAGLEYKITRQFNLWFQTNNIFNNKYERWNQYPVYGFNLLGGIIFSFNQK